MNHKDDIVINFSEQALIQMLAAALEAFAVPYAAEHSAWTGIETYLTLWGNQTVAVDLTTINVEFALVSTAAERDYTSVAPNSLSIDLNTDLISSFFPQYQLVGDFHGHSWVKQRGKKMTPASIRKDWLYGLLPADMDCTAARAKDYYDQHNYISAILTITNTPKVNKSSDGYIDTNLLEFSFGNYKCWLSCYVYSQEDDDPAHFDEGAPRLYGRDDIMLRAPALLNLNAYQPFDKAVDSRKSMHKKYYVKKAICLRPGRT